MCQLPGQLSNMNAIASLSSTLYWGMIELGVAIFVACLPTIQKAFRSKDGKGILSRIGALSKSKSHSSSAFSRTTIGSKTINKQRICVDDTIDITYESTDTDMDSRPILSGPDPLWTRRSKKGDNHVADIELQGYRSS